MENKQQFSLWYFMGTLALLLLVQQFFDSRHTETLAYSDFKQVLRAGQLQEVVLSDTVATGRIKREGLERVLPKEKFEKLKDVTGEHRFVTVLVNDPALVSELDQAKVRYTAVAQNKWLSAVLS